MSRLKLFKVVDNVVELDKEEVRLYRPLARLLARDKGSPGDVNGAKKYYAFKEFKYLYFVCSNDAYPRLKGLSEKETHRFALEQAELPDNYLPDIIMQEAMDFFVDSNSSPAQEYITELLATINNSTKIVRFLRTKIDNVLSELETNFDDKKVSEIYSLQRDLLNMSSDIPKVVRGLGEALENLKKEESKSSGEVMYGGEAIPDSADPSKSL